MKRKESSYHTSGISRIDNHQTLQLDSLLLGFLHTQFQLIHIETPLVIFIQIVADEMIVVESNRCRVKRILRDGSQKSILRRRRQKEKSILNRLRGTVR